MRAKRRKLRRPNWNPKFRGVSTFRFFHSSWTLLANLLESRTRLLLAATSAACEREAWSRTFYRAGDRLHLLPPLLYVREKIVRCQRWCCEREDSSLPKMVL
ncbi:hypothetical protein O6H91_07G043700 [Diphasiastrum complanatum]|uniref:Uncharacterized protein n=1 Tax=Diphasiastrum complanatum TaxID=34168 RepID=A0ACC2D4G7_DIPCM|nr:hypothetical protein O6H91_07G043700 [Diphasiastrum complanatum]